MTSNTVYVPAPRSAWIALARSPSGRLFKKQILKFGEFAHPNDPNSKLIINQSVANSLVRNFKNNVADIVQVPVVDDKNAHVEDPMRNIGEVVDLTIEPDGVYATIDARKEDAANELGKTLLGVSAMMHLNYTDTRTGKKVGPTLLHTAITNRPYITGLKNFEEIIAASVDSSKEDVPVVLSEIEDEEPMPTREELIKLLKDEHDIDVEALQNTPAPAPKVEHDDLVSALTAVLSDAGVLALSNSDDGGEGETEPVSITDVAEAVIELSQEKDQLSTQVQSLLEINNKLVKDRTETEIAGYIEQGRILPVQKAAMLELALSNRAMFDKIIPDQPLVTLSQQAMETHDEPKSESIDKEIARLSEVAVSLNGRKK